MKFIYKIQAYFWYKFYAKNEILNCTTLNVFKIFAFLKRNKHKYSLEEAIKIDTNHRKFYYGIKKW